MVAEHDTGFHSVGIVADDLTGANDSAVQFASEGWKALLTFVNPVPGTAETGSVLAIVSDSRAQNGPDARASTAAAVAALGQSGVNRLFLKIDSTMRGSIVDQIHGALAAWSLVHANAFAVVCSAYPAMGRTTHEGEVLVHDVGVHHTAIGRDPVTPVTTSTLADLLPGSVNLALKPGSKTAQASQIMEALSAGTKIVTIDASSDGDLQSLAKVIDHLGPCAVPVGAAGLALEMSRMWAGPAGVPARRNTHTGTAGRVVVVVSSLHDTSRTQLKQLIDTVAPEQVRVLSPSLEVFLETGALDSWITLELASAVDLPSIVVIAAPHDRVEVTHSSSGETVSVAVAAGLATITANVFDHHGIASLVLMGGEGARAVLSRLDANALRIVRAIREGLPVGVVYGGRANGITVVTKAGGFGTPHSLVDIIPELLQGFKFEPVQNEI